MKCQQWENRVIMPSIGSKDKWLSDYGDAGWELVSATLVRADTMVLAFKRPKQEQNP